MAIVSKTIASGGCVLVVETHICDILLDTKMIELKFSGRCKPVVADDCTDGRAALSIDTGLVVFMLGREFEATTMLKRLDFLRHFTVVVAPPSLSLDASANSKNLLKEFNVLELPPGMIAANAKLTAEDICRLVKTPYIKLDDGWTDQVVPATTTTTTTTTAPAQPAEPSKPRRTNEELMNEID